MGPGATDVDTLSILSPEHIDYALGFLESDEPFFKVGLLLGGATPLDLAIVVGFNILVKCYSGELPCKSIRGDLLESFNAPFNCFAVEHWRLTSPRRAEFLSQPKRTFTK